MNRVSFARSSATFLAVCCLALWVARTGAAVDCNSPDLDEFDRLDCELESGFQDTDARLEAEYQALDQAIEAAYNRLQQEVAAEWGAGDAELPGKSTYVDYSSDKQLRRKVNFEEGFIEIERLVDDTGDIDAAIAAVYEAMNEITQDNVSDLARKDLAAQYVRDEMRRQGIDFSEPRPADNKAVLGAVAGNLPDRQSFTQSARLAASGGQSQQSQGVTTRIGTTGSQKQKLTARIPLNAGHLNELATRYQQAVIREARKQQLPPSIVYAIMETESHFNPRARSHIPAFGLMQLVPASGAKDAYNFVYKELKLLGPDYLYNAERNVELGAAYLKLVNSRYLRHITNDTSRMYCTIAAYNTGAGNVARSFVGTNNTREAAQVINRMTPQQVYDHLVENLPYEETRRYIQKVVKAQQKYRAVDQYAAL